MKWPDWLGNLVGRFAVEKIKEEPMPPQSPIIKRIPLKENQYYQGVYEKKYIFLHHTAGGSAASSIAHWASNPDHIATAYVIDRDGTIYETFDPKYWSYHLGVKGNSAIEKASIGIEICSYGSLTEKNGHLITYTGKAILPALSVEVDFRGQKKWEAYTTQQLEALRQLLPFLMHRFKIKKQETLSNWWEYQNPATLPSGIWSHGTVRKDKFDIFPQPSLLEVINDL